MCVWLQIQAAVDATMEALTAAGVIFVPFDSGSFTEVASIAWAGGLESDDYMEPEAIARYACSLHIGHDSHKHVLPWLDLAMPCAVIVLVMLHWKVCILLFGAMAGTICSRICICVVQLYSEAPGMERCDQVFVGMPMQCNACWAAISFISHNYDLT